MGHRVAFMMPSSTSLKKLTKVSIPMTLFEKFLCFLFLVLSSIILITNQTFADGLTDKEKMQTLSLNRQDDAAAYKYAQKILSMKQDPAALMKMGHLFRDGTVFPSDPAKAREYYKKARDAYIQEAENGDWERYSFLAYILSNDDFGLLDAEKSKEYQDRYLTQMKSRAEKGDPKALLALSKCYDDDPANIRWYKCFIEKNENKILELTSDAAVRNDPSAQYWYAFIFEYGKYKVQPDNIMARKWYIKSIENNKNQSFSTLAAERVCPAPLLCTNDLAVF